MTAREDREKEKFTKVLVTGEFDHPSDKTFYVEQGWFGGGNTGEFPV